MNPDTFRKYFKPSLANVIDTVKTIHPDVFIRFHSDGAIQDLIPDLIDIGIDILNPVQPECMDPLLIKKQYGHKIALNGCIGTQTVMPFDPVEKVKQKVKMYCEQLGYDGGLWIAPTHVIEPEVPWENIMAFIETASEYE